jgi:hypothetical protein
MIGHRPVANHSALAFESLTALSIRDERSPLLAIWTIEMTALELPVTGLAHSIDSLGAISAELQMLRALGLTLLLSSP